MVVIMQPALELAGVVDSPPDALVELWAEPVGDDLDGERRTIATLRQPGPFRAQLDGALDGQYTVGGYVEGVGELTPRVVELRHGNLVDVGTLEASGARGVLTGWVHDNGRPQPYVDVKVRARGSRSIVTQMTTNNGKFSLDLPAGEYLVAAFLGPRFIGQQEAVVGPSSSPLEFQLPACSQWSLPSFDRVTDDGIVVVEALGSGLHAGDRIMEINGAPATQDAETLDSPEPLNATVIGSTGVAFEATLVPICIR